jgi:hypothetical protein
MNKVEFWNFLRRGLDELSNALANEDSKHVNAVCARMRCRFREIREAVADGLESQLRREIENRPHDDEEYYTSEDEQSKSYEDEEEILERRAETDVVLSERYELDFSELVDDLGSLERMPRDEAIGLTHTLKARVPSVAA